MNAHVKLFDEICGKLGELSRVRSEEEPVAHQMDRLQTQIRKFQTDLEDTQSELREKIKSLENVQVVNQGDLSVQLKNLTDQLNAERASNTKLNADLAKSLEMGLQLQLEIQNLRSRAQQSQNEERKYSMTLQEKIRTVVHDLELTKALRDETETELVKARSRLNEANVERERLIMDFESRIRTLTMDAEAQTQAFASEKSDLLRTNEELMSEIKAKSEEIRELNEETDKMMAAFEELEKSAVHQNGAMKSLSGVAENKIVELKIALDRKTAECRDFEGHLQQSTTQAALLRQENTNLKDYIAKINVYLQSTSVGNTTSASSSAVTSAPATAPNA